MSASLTDREAIGAAPNPLGLDGIEFIEFATSRPQAFGQVLEMMGFKPVARHRSREVLLYRQGGMNLIVNAHGAGLGAAAPLGETPVITAVALRVRDAAAAYRRALERGAWGVPPRVEVMELYIPAIHGAGTSRIYFVDRWREFSIYDVDFTPIPGAEQRPPAVAGLHGFGIVQYIGLGRTEDWTAFYAELLGFSALPDEERFGILPTGRVLRSPDGSFYLQLIEPQFDALEIDQDETLHRVALGTPDVLAAVRELRARGMEFVEAAAVHTEARGALTKPLLGGVSFELVQHGAASA
ncbi:VOC family protein [Azohydromonas lata]|uniref:4-hydroxyphenylpyruvate dioxygenase n=1 Tax=Azohydromonas lata TaxID=45677 RepID=A0ABU5IQJ0_9BURK|nr:VOC family protein [Azohydromonas lata]MDZ5461148.1 4-hydroxyphenylpyruvate dioxygenase [Azohydromonas lata]